MKKILVFVSTLDGKITKWGNPSVKIWASKEDQKYFKKIWDDAKVTILGSGSYDAGPIKPDSKHHIVVMTRNPAKYKEYEVPGQIEFTNHSPKQLVTRYEKEGLSQLIIAGGAHISTLFLEAQLIDEIWLTIEPKIFGTGGNFVINKNLDVELQLLSVEKVNERGTLITKYSVNNNLSTSS